MNYEKFIKTIDEIESVKFFLRYSNRNIHPIFNQLYLNSLLETLEKLEENTLNSYLYKYPEHLPAVNHLSDNKHQHFDYLYWRKKTNKVDLNFNYYPIFEDIKSSFEKTVDINLYFNMVIEFIARELPIIDINDLKNSLIFTDLNYSYCLDFPLSKKSIILIGSENDSFLNIIYMTHEIGHYIFNHFKYLNNVLVLLEIDEFYAHYFEIWILKSLLKSEEYHYYLHILSNILNENMLFTYFQYKVYKDPHNFNKNYKKDNLFKNLKKFYNKKIDKNIKVEWKSELQNNSPFIQGCYILGQTNALNQSLLPKNIIKSNIIKELDMIKSFSQEVIVKPPFL